MIKEKKDSHARVVDFDDTLIGRERVTRGIGLLRGKHKSGTYTFPTYDDISCLTLDHEPKDAGIDNIVELFSFFVHSKRRVFPGVQRELFKLISEGVDVYGNTGRSNKVPWVSMTEKTLRRGGVRDYFSGIFYTPDGTKTAVSKAHALHHLSDRYEQLEFDDDDPRTALFIAKLFPDIQVNLIQYGSTGLLVDKKELDDELNLRRVLVFEAHPTHIV